MANSEIIAEIDRIDRGQMDNYYKMINCQNAMLDQFPDNKVDPDRGYDYSKTFIKDLAEPGNQEKEMSLAQLQGVVSNDAQKGILDINDAFIEKATQCVDMIHESGIARTHYREHQPCKDVKKEAVKPYLVLDHYCMPEFSRIAK